MQRLLFVLALCTLANASQADAPEYSYFRPGYTVEILDGRVFEDIECPGAALDFSKAFGEHWALIANHYECDGDRTGFSFDPQLGLFIPIKIKQESTLVGALYHVSLGGGTDFIASIEYGAWEYYQIHKRFFSPFKNADEAGYRLAAGIKSRFFGRVEGGLLVRQFQFMETDNFFVENKISDVSVEGDYYFNDKISLGLSFISNDFSDRFTVNAGYAF